jgi:hypothetical protein
MVTGEVQPAATPAGGDEGDRLLYTLSVPGVEGKSEDSLQQIAQVDIEPAGALGERYEQVLGPYNDFGMILTHAIRLGNRRTLSRDVDIIGINWPEWFLLMEIRGSGVEVPLPRDHPEWRWYMAVIAR